jgi:hypothetical protein
MPWKWPKTMDSKSTSSSLDYAQLFELYDPLANRPLRLGTRGHSDWLTKEQATSLFRDELQLESPLPLGAYSGGQATDFLWCALTPLVVVSERVVRLLQDLRFTGWATYPVDVYDRKGVRLAQYHGFAVTGRAGKRDRTRSMVVSRPAPGPGGRPYQVYRGFYFDEGPWDGSDIFLAGGLTVTRCPVQEAFKRARVSNVRFTPLEDVEIRVSLDKYDGEYQNEKHYPRRR